MLPLRSQPSLGVEGVEVDAVVEVVATVVTVEETEIQIQRHLPIMHLQILRPAAPPNIRGPNIPICRQGSGKGALCTSAGGGGHFSVLSPPPAPGKMSSPPSQPNETGTSPRSL